MEIDERTGFLRGWMHEDELRPSDPLPKWMIKTAKTPFERRIMLTDWYCFWGYNDAVLGIFRDGFEGWQQPHQEVYQCGRMIVARMRAEGFAPPLWQNRTDLNETGQQKLSAGGEEVALWLEDWKRRNPNETLLPKATGGNNVALA